MSKLRVLMIGPGRMVKGGISTVIDNYYAIGLDRLVDLTYLPTMEDGTKIKKLIVAAGAYMRFGKLTKKVILFMSIWLHRRALVGKHYLLKKLIKPERRLSFMSMQQILISSSLKSQMTQKEGRLSMFSLLQTGLLFCRRNGLISLERMSAIQERLKSFTMV